MSDREGPPDFQGLHPNKPLRVYRRHLPHWRQSGATYFVTFRQHDSLPQSKLDELNHFRQEWLEKQASNSADERDASAMVGDELTREVIRRVESWLDQGMGTCRLRKPVFANHVANAMHHFDNERYELDCYVVMPNHVHVALRPFDDDDNALERILQSWKRHSSREINQAIGASGTFWQEESFDRIIRDCEHLCRVVQYIGNNPTRAGLRVGEYLRWVRPEWASIGWDFES